MKPFNKEYDVVHVSSSWQERTSFTTVAPSLEEAQIAFILLMHAVFPDHDTFRFYLDIMSFDPDVQRTFELNKIDEAPKHWNAEIAQIGEEPQSRKYRVSVGYRELFRHYEQSRQAIENIQLYGTELTAQIAATPETIERVFLKFIDQDIFFKNREMVVPIRNFQFSWEMTGNESSGESRRFTVSASFKMLYRSTPDNNLVEHFGDYTHVTFTLEASDGEWAPQDAYFAVLAEILDLHIDEVRQAHTQYHQMSDREIYAAIQAFSRSEDKR